MDATFSESVQPDWESFVACIERRGTPRRVHNIELFLDWEIEEAICTRFGLLAGLPEDTWFRQKRAIAVQRFLGYDYVRQGVEGLEWPLKRSTTDEECVLSVGLSRFSVSVSSLFSSLIF